MTPPTVWIDVQNPTEAAEAVATAEAQAEAEAEDSATAVLAAGSPQGVQVQDCTDTHEDDMLSDEMSSVPKGPRSRPIPTAVMQAIQEGYPLGHPTTVGVAAAPTNVIDDEKSVPTDLKPHDEVVYRIRKLEAGHVELGRAIGQVSSDVRTGFAELAGEMKSLVTFADLAEKRAVAKETAEANARATIAAAEINAAAAASAAASAARVEGDRARTIESGHNVEITKRRISYREKIQLAIIGLVSTALLGYLAMNHVTLK